MSFHEFHQNLVLSGLHLLLFCLFQYIVKSGLLWSIDKDLQDPIRWVVLNRSYISIGYLHFLLYLAYSLAFPYLTPLSSFFVGCFCMCASYTPLMHGIWIMEKYRDTLQYSSSKEKMSSILSYYIVQAMYLLVSMNHIFCPGRLIGMTYLFWNMTLMLRSNQTFRQQMSTVVWLSFAGLNWAAVQMSVSKMASI
jgi:hypothetical protein